MMLDRVQVPFLLGYAVPPASEKSIPIIFHYMKGDYTPDRTSLFLELQGERTWCTGHKLQLHIAT